ncbi:MULTISPECIES: CAP domain-containing protein [Streptomyces]|uniref:CAP domain-containing protein n=1 Tax=Streptomyces fuscus TaxID=3048495 RepID=A0ABT7J7N1_9ACTN|nr:MULTISPECIES: CAP domain-containing protein [Streptomyces]MCM1977376.1 CAP domain-containing protein [Streptomyces sp. G1]MDL2080866.1 CAP domain-containing protein [Streptomyces fuscus]
MSELVPGGNVPLPGGAVAVRVRGPFDVSALVTDDSGKVGGDADFVFYNQPSAPGVRLDGDTLTVDPARLRAGATRVTVVVSPAEPGTALGTLPAPTLRVTGSGGRTLARFAPPRPRQETVLLLAELYRRGGGWKLRALGQGYADGLAGLARDFGVDVVDEPPAAAAAPDHDGIAGLVNSARAGAGSPPVTLDARLTAAAREHAAAMAAAGRLGVEGRDGVSVYQRVTAAGYAYLTIGEHLVSGPRSPAEFVDYCLRTGQTRATLCDPEFTHAGLAHVPARSGDVYWTALWARPFSPADLARTAARVVDLTNRERAGAGLRPLRTDSALTAAAQAHSADMVARSFYSHTSPEGSQPWDRAAAAGARRRSIGENIACGQRSPAEVVRGWMNSPGHRANILKPDFTHIGIGFAGGGPSGMYWTQLFGA